MPFFNFIASLILPVYGAIFAIPSAIKENSSRLYLASIALAFATIAFCIDPNEGVDLYRHYLRIESLKGLPFDIAVSNIFSGYFFFDIFAWVINFYDLPKQLFTALVVFTSYYMMLSIGDKLIDGLYNKTNSLIIACSFIIFLLNINYISLALGLRSTFSYVIVFYACFYLIENKKVFKFFAYSFIAFLIHPSSSIPFLIMLIAYLLPGLSKHGKLIVLIAVIFMLLSDLVTPIIQYLDSLASQLPFYKSGAYTDSDSQWGGGFADHASFKGWIATYIILRMPTYLGIFYILVTKVRRSDKLYTAVVLCILYIGLFFGYQTFSSRLTAFYIFIFSFFLVKEQLHASGRFNLYFVLVYLASLLLIWLLNLYSFSDIFSSANEVFYKPLVFILTAI